MKLGFRFKERMTGLFHFLAAPLEDLDVHLALTGHATVGRFLREPRVRVEGTLDVEGFAAARPVEGTILLEPPDRRLRYNFAFVADDGAPYLLSGEKDVQLIALVESMTTLPASLYAGDSHPYGTEVGRALLRFDVRKDWLRFLRSWRLEGALW